MLCISRVMCRSRLLIVPNPSRIFSAVRVMALVILYCACFAQTCAAQSWSGDLTAHYLVDEATGQPLATRPDRRPEVFVSSEGRANLGGHFTGVRLEREERPSGEKFPPLKAGDHIKIRGKDQWVRVEECCRNARWMEAQPGWIDYYRDITRWLENFGFTPDGLPETLDLTCVPLVWAPVFLYAPGEYRPRWTKLYAVARKQYDVQFRLCEQKEAYVYSYAKFRLQLDDETALVDVDDASPEYARTLLVDARTGEIVGPNPGGFKAIDAYALLRFKDEFLRKNPCPLLSAFDKARYTSLEDQMAKTKAGRCYRDRLKRYERSVIHHFLGQPTESLEP